MSVFAHEELSYLPFWRSSLRLIYLPHTGHNYATASASVSLSVRDSMGIYKLPLIQLMLQDKICSIRSSSDILLLSLMLWSRRRKIFTVKKQIKNILPAPHLEQNISLPFSFPFPVKYCEIIQAGVSKLILKRLHIPLIYQKLIMSMIFLTIFYFLNKQDKVF